MYILDDDSGSCAVGFLNRQSLNMIVDAPTGQLMSTSLNVRQDFLMTTQSMPLNETGRHIKFVIAAKFNHSACTLWLASATDKEHYTK